MASLKVLVYLSIAIYICFQLIYIIPQFSGQKIITVFKRNYGDSNTYVKGYKVEKAKFEQFDVKVTPGGFWDRLLLTNNDGEDLLGDLLKVVATLTVVLYIYNLRYDNVFSKKSFNLFWLIWCACVFTYLAYSEGLSHTRDFWRDLYMAQKGDANMKYDFESGPKLNPFSHNWLYFYCIPFFVMQLYKEFKNHHEGKVEEEW